MASPQGPHRWTRSDMGLKAALNTARGQIEARLEDAFDWNVGALGDLVDAMSYATLDGGKRLRGFLVIEGARLSGAPQAAALDAAAAIECMHAYSLIHDDLPAMDDDAMRRGKPTVHIEFGEATAILAGDALQAKAFELVAGIAAVPAERVLDLLGMLARAAGERGMVGGQMWDMELEGMQGKPADPLGTIAGVQRLKTGALFEWSAQAGPVLAGKDPAPLRAYAEALGRAFQVQDDLLDVEATAEEMGKAVRKDAGRGKVTFISELGVEGARTEARRLVDAAIGALDPYGKQAKLLIELAQFVIERRN